MADTPVPTPKRILDIDKTQMFADVGEGKRRAKLTWSIQDGKPRVTIYTNDPDDIDKGILSTPMYPDTYFCFSLLFKEVVKGPVDNRKKIDCFIPIYENGKVTQQRRLLSELWFGKDKDGLIWISIVAPNRPKIKFTYQLSHFVGVYNGDGSAISEADASCLAASGTITLLDSIFSAYSVHLVNAGSGPDDLVGASPVSTTTPSNDTFDTDIPF